ncbi:serine/threonine-protein kinase [Paludisphaera rhizosphaerae]|nr:serine/threonine-protein kinase [Paludisphaera rhizosphaerae]
MADVEPSRLGPFRFQIGSYGVLHPLGSGGMSSVFYAVHVETGHEVALKVLPTAMARNPTILKRFVAEARSVESLQHPNIVQIFDRGSDDGRYYLVLEYVQGGDLHEYVQHQGPLPAVEAAGLIAQVARGLEYAASRGVIHRDVKPSNILRTPQGEVKIADLGLAVRPEEDDERVTREGTTVGTVDYMSPEQARDSRATSLQSDIYSLGCTLHYLLTGLPPYPGGDITEKLTKHARNPPPDVLAVRPDLPPALGTLLVRMMAKHPADRFASYSELLSALSSWLGNESSVSLVPIDDAPPAPRPAPRIASPQPPVPDSQSLPEISLSSLAPGFLHEAEPSVDSIPKRPTPTLAPTPRTPPRRTAEIGSTVSDDVWILRCVLIGAAVVASVIGLDLIFRPLPDVIPPHSTEPSRNKAVVERGGTPPQPVVESSPPIAQRPQPATAPPPVAKPAWEEPVDPPAESIAPKVYSAGVRSAYLPAWAQEPVPSEIPGPRTIIRRVSGTEEPGAIASLRQGLDVTKGVVELADVGPFMLDDLRIPGETRLVRSRPGYRAAVRIGSPRIDLVRNQPGVFALDGRTLILDSLDLMVNVRDLSTHQKALFHGSGFNLTLRNCTVTIFNPSRTPFAFVRADDAAGRSSRVRIEDSVIQGDVSPLFDLGRGAVEVAVVRSFLASDGSIVRTPDASPQAKHRFYTLGSALGGRGPLIDLAGGPKSDPDAQRLIVRAYDTLFARIAGSGVASLTVADSASASLDRQLDWLGAKNMYAGWVGYFSTGPERKIQVGTLAAFGSTWSAEEDSQSLIVEWPASESIAELAPTIVAPYSPGWDELIKRLPVPRPKSRERVLYGFAPPPEATIAPLAEPAPRGTVELTFDAEAAGTGGGDLGAFLRARVGKPEGRLRVRVTGSGPHPFTPVRLAAGSTVEIVVEPAPPDHPPLVFVPDASATPDALISMEGGTLSILGGRFRIDRPTSLESLIRVDDGSLALRRCEITAPQALDQPPPRLVDFRARTTRPRPPAPHSPIVGAGDRPACVISECVLITTGDAVRAAVGRGIVAVSRSAIGARGDVFTLEPAPVARARFDADLTIYHSTIATARTAVRVVDWPGEAPGPDRPWLVTSTHTAYVDLSPERSSRESVLCRADAEAFAQGQFFWRQRYDAIELAAFAAAGEAPPPNRIRDVAAQWADLWGDCNVDDVAGPHPGSASTSVRLQSRPRPGRLEPSDLTLDPEQHLGRGNESVGADPSVFVLDRRSGQPHRRR